MTAPGAAKESTTNRQEINMSKHMCLLILQSREVKCVIHTPMIESSIPCLREAVCVRMGSYLTIACRTRLTIA